MLPVSSQRKNNFYHQNTRLDAFRKNSRNIIGRNPSMVIPLLANQDLTAMLVGYQRNHHRRKQPYWQESFDGDSFVSQSRFDAYAPLNPFNFCALASERLAIADSRFIIAMTDG